ncbi:MAG TPA: hypothetical protein VF188_03575 [Longimicrobiales bacterium]
MRRLWAPALVAALAGCASGGRGGGDDLRVSAGDAAREAWTVARTWAEDPALRYVEGEGVTWEGTVPSEGGTWRFIYGAPERPEQLVVTVTPRTLERATRPPQSPPGFAVGDASLGGEWVDSRAVLAAVRAAGGEALRSGDGGAAISMLLVPLRPPQWVVRVVTEAGERRWRVNAETGEVLPS